MKVFQIDEQLRDLFPPLTKEEFEQLEVNILRDGCTSPLFVWKGYIVDGHNRYNICTKNDIEFQTIELAYESKEDIIQWMIDTQLGRRNLTPIQRIVIAEKYRPLLMKKAKESQLSGLRQNTTVLQKSDQTEEKIHTRDELAKIAGVSHDTYSKAKKILDSENEDLKEKVKSGEMKINTAYNELTGKTKEPKEEIAEENIIPEKPIQINDHVSDAIKELKTPKSVINTFNFLNEIENIKETLKYSIDFADDTLFSRRNMDGLISESEKTIALECIEALIGQMQELKNKINNIAIMEETKI